MSARFALLTLKALNTKWYIVPPFFVWLMFYFCYSLFLIFTLFHLYGKTTLFLAKGTMCCLVCPPDGI